MKQHLKQILVFSITCWVVLIGLQFGIDTLYKKRVSNKVNQLLNHQIDAPIMIFGSSVAIMQFDPAIIEQHTGLKCYNMGLHGTHFIQYSGLINEYLQYTKKAKLILLVCDIRSFAVDTFLMRPDLYLAHINKPNVYDALYQVESSKVFLARYLPGYKLTLFNKKYYNPIVFNAPNKKIKEGYKPSREIWTKKDNKEVYNRLYVYEPYFDNFLATIARIQAQGIKVMMILPPIQNEGYALLTNIAGIKAHFSRASKICNVPYEDYSQDSICAYKDLFVDYSHLNAEGAALFTHKIGPKIAAYLQQ